MTKQDALAYRDRWLPVNEAEVEELRRTSVDDKVRQFVVMMSAVRELGWTEALSEEDEAVRARWVRLHHLPAGRPEQVFRVASDRQVGVTDKLRRAV